MIQSFWQSSRGLWLMMRRLSLNFLNNMWQRRGRRLQRVGNTRWPEQQMELRILGCNSNSWGSACTVLDWLGEDANVTWHCACLQEHRLKSLSALGAGLCWGQQRG
eukprot:270034-Prorocentrum_lima.AAC.1